MPRVKFAHLHGLLPFARTVVSMGIFRRMFLGRAAGAFLFAFILLTPSAAGACATTSYSYTVTYTPLKPAPTPPASGIPFTYNYFEPRTVSQSSMASLPSTYNTATQFDNGTGLATSSQSRPATLDASSVTYSYQINQPVLTDNLVDEGSNHWHPNLQDEGSNHWHSSLVDEGSNHWHSNVVDRGHYAGGFVYQTYWVDTSHTAYNRHRNRNAAGTVLYACDIPHTHDPIEGDCGGHTGLVRSHDNRAYWHSTGYWGGSWAWVDNINWVENLVDEGSNHWHANVVDYGSNHWHANVVDRGSNHWHANVVNRPIWVDNWVTYTSQPSLPPGVRNVTYNANYVAQDQYISTSRVPAAGAYQITYNYVALLTGCARPT